MPFLFTRCGGLGGALCGAARDRPFSSSLISGSGWRQFQRTERGWRERLVDVAPDDDPRHLRLVLAPRETPASRLLLPRRLQGLPAASGGAAAMT